MSDPHLLYSLGTWTVQDFVSIWTACTTRTAQHQPGAREAFLLVDAERPGRYVSVSPRAMAACRVVIGRSLHDGLTSGAASALPDTATTTSGGTSVSPGVVGGRVLCPPTVPALSEDRRSGVGRGVRQPGSGSRMLGRDRCWTAVPA